VTADPSQVTRLFENLFRNAVEHGSTSPRSQTHEDAVEHGSTSSQPKADNAVERGNGDVDVRVGRLADAGFYVADDGPGIPPEEREKVFEWAYSLGGDDTGFGLAIVRQIAEAHGWAIAVTESESGGARFEFRGVDIGNTSA
jgi:signal transduction histidine kinase